MGRKKQSRPRRSVGVLERHDDTEAELDTRNGCESQNGLKDEIADIDRPLFIQVDRSYWLSDDHRDISEVVLTDLNFGQGFSGYIVDEKFYQDFRYSLRFRLANVGEFLGRIKLGHWPVLPATSIHLELIAKNVSEDVETQSMILSGVFNGPEDGVSGLVQLVSLKFLSLRPLLGAILSEDVLSLRLRVEILENAFDACESLLDNRRQLWKKSMMNVMAWLRPEVTTSETRYRVSTSAEMELHLQTETSNCDSISRKQAGFDVAGFYEAIKPSKEYPMLEDNIRDLLPKLRPYQRRAAYWMVQREKGPSGSLVDGSLFSPLCVPVDFVDTHSRMFYNPFSGNVSLHPDYTLNYVFGGILADEMGLGKTVELLICIFAHRKSASEDGMFFNNAFPVTVDQKNSLKRVKKERVECICGSVSESSRYKGLWVQCDICDAWQHADCVGFSPRGKSSKSRERNTNSAVSTQKNIRKKTTTDIVLMDEEHICQLCLELIQATDSPVATGATLIVCPAPILSQWHAEIIRHTTPGSLKTHVYEGVRSGSISNGAVADIGILINADIVLTTYDVLKEDLSHDSDRHEGDRRFMRFQKRYPVIPTLLTRIFWWRICLDEAQMVESNTSAATEMALRLHAKHHWCITGTPIQRKLDDLYGLLRFLKASPFDAFRWWTEVIRDPYERRDIGAVEFTQKFFKQIMWRSSKAHVADELQLPPQEESLSWLYFSPIEEHFYQRQHETCMSYAREVIESFRANMPKRENQGSDSSDAPSDPYITHMEAAKLLNSLLKLRQACCHPQVGSSGLRSLQQSPMTMEEILEVLVGKTKIEGEEALRRVITATNGLAGIAIIKKDLSQAVSLYKEALLLTEEHSKDFRLDPLLSLHIHYNLAEILLESSEHSQQFSLNGGQFSGNFEEKASRVPIIDECEENALKRQKVSRDDQSDLNIDCKNSPDSEPNIKLNGYSYDRDNDAETPVSSKFYPDECLRVACENIKKKYLLVFNSKLSVAQQDFRKSYMQVSDALNDRKYQNATWWLEALDLIERSSDSTTELIKKIGDAISGSLNSSKSSRIASGFRSVSALKYHIQSSLDSLEASRKILVDRLLQVDQTMEKPREEDIDRVRYCPNCQANGDGLMCVHCEMDELFQIYEARLFRLNKAHGGIITSADEAVNLQKKNSALNRFYWNLSQPNKNSTASSVENEESMRRRDVGEKVVVSKSPSELEVILGVVKSYSKSLLRREGMSAATKQLLLLESMRKEYTHARSLATAQAQVLRAHDEVKMATSRLRLRENENETSIDALSFGELDEASIELTHGKLMALTSLSRIRGQLRYLEGLVLSKQKLQSESPNSSSLNQDMVTSMISAPAEERTECLVKTAEETCPVCQEKLSNQKMVFQCGHVTCCKCLFAMTEQRIVRHGKLQDKWVMCPTCRQHTNFENIAYADDGQNKLSSSSMLPAFQGQENSEAFVTVQGSYGAKIEAVTRRILWIKATDPEAKILLFSSWNDVLDVLEHALTANDISYIRMKGGRKSHVAISHFRGQKIRADGTGTMHDQQPKSKWVQVLLLLIQHGANGLNLLEAQHVILVEPLLNPAAEAQAISRVHRIGQEKRTLVHRFIVKDTVEESILVLNKSRSSSSFISGNKKNQDEAVLTLKDVESLFAAVPSGVADKKEKPTGSLMHLPPSVAAAIAAERRLKEQAAT